jgi:hypothetical protein
MLLSFPALAACNRDGACWAPQDGQQGAGGGPVVPVGQGGFGEEPTPEPQGSDEARWECRGAVIDCTNQADPHVRMCPAVTSWGSNEDAALNDAVAQCEYALLVEHHASYLCESTIMDCVELHPTLYRCSGSARCKRGTQCKAAGEEWFNACPFAGVAVSDFSPEMARQQLLDECQETLAAKGDPGPWFCMPGGLSCAEE